MPAIACNCTSIGSLGKLLLETTGDGTSPRTFNGSSRRLEFIYEKLGATRNLMHSGAINGTTSDLIIGVREKSYLVQGVVALQPSPANLAIFMPLITGGTTGAGGSGTGEDVDEDGADVDIPLANTIPSFDMLVYRESGIFQYTNLRVAQAILRGKTANGGEADEYMQLILVLIGEQEIITQTGDASPWPASEPALPTTVANLPYAFYESDAFLNTVAVPHESVDIKIDNRLSVKFFNEIYPTCIRSTGRVCTMDLKLPFTCDGLEQSLSLNTTTGTAEFRMATPSADVTFHFSIDFPYARSTFKTPVIEGKQDIPFEVSITGYATAGNDQIAITNDSTP